MFRDPDVWCTRRVEWVAGVTRGELWVVVHGWVVYSDAIRTSYLHNTFLQSADTNSDYHTEM
jgi:hypothetical protein